jgi:lipopolysaccharide transport system ATP-binding protein
MKVVKFNKVWKKYTKGEKFNSLRDAIPHLFRRTLKGSSEVLLNKEFWVIKDVSFEVEKGEVLGIIGSNGAGKSTILKLLSRIIVPNKGALEITGRLSALIEVTAGFHPELTGRENVYLNGTILGMRRKEIDSKFDEIVEFSGVSEFIDTPVKRYSSGMYARLGFSVAAHMNPDVMLVDEVLAVGDMSFQAKCSQKMRALIKQGTTIVLVSHNLSLIQNMCKRVILLNKGEVLKIGLPEEVVPYYKNMVYKVEEEKLKETQSSADYKIRVAEESPARITSAVIYDGESHQKDTFRVGEIISVKVDFETKEKIESPIFWVGIIRADEVLCCSSNTKEENCLVDSIYGKGAININFGKLNLGPGIYMINISAWDREGIHPYFRQKLVFKIETEGLKEHDGEVFLPKVQWTINNK